MKYTKILENIDELNEQNVGEFLRYELKIPLESEDSVDDDEITMESAKKSQNGDVFTINFTSEDGFRRLTFVFNQYDYYLYEQYKICTDNVVKTVLESKEQHRLGKQKFNKLVAKYVQKYLGEKQAQKYLNLANGAKQSEFEEELLV